MIKICLGGVGRQMSDTNNIDNHKIRELKEMIKRNQNQPVEKVLVIFCERHGLTMEACRYYYNLLVDKGEIQEK